MHWPRSTSHRRTVESNDALHITQHNMINQTNMTHPLSCFTLSMFRVVMTSEGGTARKCHTHHHGAWHYRLVHDNGSRQLNANWSINQSIFMGICILFHTCRVQNCRQNYFWFRFWLHILTFRTNYLWLCILWHNGQFPEFLQPLLVLQFYFQSEIQHWCLHSKCKTMPRTCNWCYHTNRNIHSQKAQEKPSICFFPNRHQTILLVQVFTFCIVFLVLHMAKNTTNHRCLILHVYISKTKPAGKTTLLESISKSAIVHNAESLRPRNKLWGYTAPRTGRSFITAGRVQPILS